MYWDQTGEVQCMLILGLRGLQCTCTCNAQPSFFVKKNYLFYTEKKKKTTNKYLSQLAIIDILTP